MEKDIQGKEDTSWDSPKTLVNDKICELEALQHKLGAESEVYTRENAKPTPAKGKGDGGRGERSTLDAQMLIAEFGAKYSANTVAK